MIAIKRRCLGCGRELSGEGEEVLLCDECEAGVRSEALELLEREDVGKRRDEAMMYA